MRFRPGLRPGPRWGSSRRSPRPPNRWGGGYPLPKNPPPSSPTATSSRRLRRLDPSNPLSKSWIRPCIICNSWPFFYYRSQVCKALRVTYPAMVYFIGPNTIFYNHRLLAPLLSICVLCCQWRPLLFSSHCIAHHLDVTQRFRTTFLRSSLRSSTASYEAMTSHHLSHFRSCSYYQFGVCGGAETPRT